jgi:two-component system, cell cycle sensor histidine kinase and response regulator CckA
LSKAKKTEKFRSLAVTLAIGFSVLTMAALVIATTLQMYFSFQAQQKIILTNQKLIAKNAANAVEYFIHEKFTTLESTSLRRNIPITPKAAQEPILERLMGFEPAFRKLILFNSQKEEIARISRITKIITTQPENYSKDELFQKTASKETYIGPVYIDEITSEPMMIMAVPVTDVFGDYMGTLIAELNLKFMWDLMERISIGENGSAYVVEKQGYLIAYRDISPVLKRENLTHLREVNLFIKEKSTTADMTPEISRGINNTLVIASHVPLASPEWAVVVELPVLEAYHPVVMTLILSGSVMLLSLILAIISGIFLSRRLTKPVIELRDATEKIGKGQLSLEIDIHSNNEIGDLAKSFSMMVNDLKITTVSRDALEKEVNERKQVEKILMESEQKMKAILMASPIGIGLINNGRLEWANDTLFTLTGYDKKALLEKEISLLYMNNAEFTRVNKELFTIDADSITHAETQWVKKDGTILDCVLGACALDHKDPSKGIILTVIDISEAKELQSKLMRAQKMEVIGTLAAGVAHDLNNILGGVVSYPELLIIDMPDSNPLKGPLLTIKKAGEKAAAIVQDLLTLARRGVTINDVVNLNNIVTEFLKSPEYENIISFHSNIRVDINLDESLLNIIGSSFHISKIIMNLVSNSSEAMPQGGTILISTENQYLDKPVSGYENIREGEYVTLTVSDTGEGIPEADLIKIFEPFYTKKKMGRSGTGLGMTVVWGTVKDHKGYVDIRSKENQGTTITLYFPASRESTAAKKISMPIDLYMSKGESILVVDDVEEQRVVLSQILNKLGYRVTAVTGGEEAVEYLKNSSADLIVLDMIMEPGINGLETYKQILETRPGQKAIIASGFSETEHVKETLRLGALAYVKKPYNIENIGWAIRDALDR